MNQTPSTIVEANWPKEPYKGFSYYTFEDTLLFVGRDDDVDDCAAYLAEPKTRTLLLHGRTGCGKSSFLRAGLIPALESRGFGFVFLRRNEGERPVLIRCTAEPMTRIAEELFWFTAHPWRVETAIDSRVIDISSARFKKDNIRSFTEACRDPYFLMKVLKEISEKLLHTLVIILDQAEEAITQTDTPSPFFDFLKLFNGTNLDIKLLIALRTERFGEFFGYLHFGASVITDVKQYFLQGLDRSKVRQAIELPTLKTAIEGPKSPFDVYGFTYEEGLVDSIVSDLFSAPPSGGILPLMQVVCRGLYNEVRNLVSPKVITQDRYKSGDGVSGRVDKQIGQSLRAAIRSNQPTVRDIEMEERKWRAGLYKLVRTQPDGTVGTDLKTEEDMNRILRESQVSGDVQAILEKLADPEVLLLRSFRVISADTGSEIVLYSLGHDAIGLVLRQWRLREEEAEKTRAIELSELRRAKIARMAGIVGLTGLFLSFLYIGELTKRRKMVEVDVLQSYADNQFGQDPSTAANAAISAALVTDSIWLKGLTRSSPTTLANIAATLPQATIRSSFVPSRRTPGTGFVLTRSKKFLFWNADAGVEIVSWDGLARTKLDLVALFGFAQRAAPVSLENATEAATDLFLLRFKTVTGAEFLSIVQNGKVVGVYDAEYFAGLSKDVQSLFDKQPLNDNKALRPVRPQLLHLGIDANIVYLSRWSGSNSIVMTAFFLDTAASGIAGRFREGSAMADTSATETVFRHFLTMPPGIAILITYMPAPQPAPGPSEQKDARRSLGDLQAFDFRKNQDHLIWSLATSEISLIKDCVGRVEPRAFDDSSDACVIKNMDRGISNYLMIVVPPRNKPASTSDASDDAPAMLIAMDVEAKQSIVIDTSKIVKSSEGAAFASKRRTLDFRRSALGGVFGSMVLAVANGQVIDVFRIEGTDPRFVGTYTAVSTVGQIFFSDDGQTMASINGNVAQLWDISQPTSATSAVLAKDRSAEQLIKTICASELPVESEDTWRDLIGLDGLPNKPCAGQ